MYCIVMQVIYSCFWVVLIVRSVYYHDQDDFKVRFNFTYMKSNLRKIAITQIRLAINGCFALMVS